MAADEWREEQRILTRSTCEAAHAAWQIRYNAAAEAGRGGWVAQVAGDLAPNAEPTAGGFIPSFPVITNPGHMDGFTGTEKQVNTRLIVHSQKVAQFRLETSIHKALKQLFAAIAPKPLHSDKVGAGGDDIDLYAARELLGHLKSKHGKAAATE